MNAPVPADSHASSSSAPESGRRHWISSVRLVGLLTFGSRILGLLRDIGMAATFGNGALLDSFTLAFRIPNLSRRLFGEGALTAAFLPEFVKADQQSKERGERLATAVFFSLAIILTLGVVAGELLLWWMWKSAALGGVNQQIYVFTAGLLPYVVFICLSAQLSAVLHAQRDFATPAIVPIWLNLVWILGLAIAASQTASRESQMLIVIGWILVGGVGQFLLPFIQLLRKGFRFRRDWRKSLQQCRRVYGLMLPIVLGLSVLQLNSICDSTLAWWYSQPEQKEYVATGTAAALYFGQRMYQFPLGVFGIALSTVLFAELARHAEAGDRKQLAEDVQTGIRLSWLIGLPASVGLVLIAGPLTDCLFRHGAFDAEDVKQTAGTVAAYGTAIWAYLGISVLQRVFYALEDARTPMRLGIVAVAINVVLNFVLLFTIGGVGLAYATAVSSAFQFAMLTWMLRYRLTFHNGSGGWAFAGKIGLATLVMGISCGGMLVFCQAYWPGNRWLQLFLPLLAAIGSYATVLNVLRLEEMALLLGRRTGHLKG
ncbi:MAG: murein biosynthesis integral membrane protein MurJ [Rubinisphaera brasiliensis]|uniref:murein biosynthesis integral membrane protein MurJ n=1 Tax=Rubinisphaera brasiliensis TaxID=119 RepID=UPI00391AA352